MTTPAPLATPAARRRWRLAAITTVLGAGAFGTLAVLVPGPLTDDFDVGVLRLLRGLDDPSLPVGGRVVADTFRDITALGGPVVLMMVVGLVAGYLAVDRRLRDAGAVLAASIGALALDVLLKLAFGRDRPSVVPHLVVAHSGSFPSGHSMLAAVVYPTLGAMLARFAKRRATQVLPIVAAVVITVLVGVSRLVLGVHYPTDVLAGWAAGAAWAGCVWLVVDRLARQGAVEGRGSTPSPAPPTSRT
ncbi:MAG: phosphatase PAP2 family protein [Planctomycetota bacterium]